jgi:hypothetical protein
MEVLLMRSLAKASAFAAVLMFGSVIGGFGQSQSPAQQPATDYEQRVTKALDAAKKSADALNERHKALVEAVKRAADPQQAQKVLDELIASATKALEGFGENSEMMQAVSGLLAFIEERRKNAEEEAKTDAQWVARVAAWKAHGENIRQLREALLREVDRSKIFLDKLMKEKKLISDMIAGESVAKAKEEMDKALADLKALGDSLEAAVAAAQNREKTIPAF